MKRIIALLLFAGLVAAPPAEAKRKEKQPPRRESVSTEKLEAALRRAEHDCDSLKREFGYAMWTHYLDEQIQCGRNVDFRKLPNLNVEDFCKKDPELSELNDTYAKLDEDCKRIYRARPEYANLHREYRIAVHAGDKQALAKNKTDYEEFYSRLEREDSVYKSLEQNRKQALYQRNYALLRRLIADYRARMAQMPVDGAIGTDPYQTKRNLLRSFPELQKLERSITQLNQILNDLSKELMNRKYRPESEPDEETPRFGRAIGSGA